MTIVKQLVGVAAAVALIITPLAGAHAAEDEEKTSIRLPVNMDQVDSLNPFLVVFQAGIDVLEYQYQPLAGLNETGKRGPILADDFTVDGVTWTYHIRDAATWSDGEPVTSADVVWTYEAIMNNKSLQTASGGAVSNIESVRAIDDKTVEFVVDSPTPLHPGIVAVVPKHIWENIEDPAEYENVENVVGNGPFILDEYVSGTSITMRSNPHYWGGETGVDELQLIGFKNTDAQVLALRNGEIDMMQRLSAAQFESLASVDGIDTYQIPSKRFVNLTLNNGRKTTSGEAYGTQNPVLEDPEFRKALAQAIDRPVLVDRVIKGLGSEGPTVLPPGSASFNGIEDSFPLGMEEAKKTLEAAGYVTDADGNRLDKQGVPITLRLMFAGDTTEYVASAEFIESWYKDLGITMTLKNTNWDEMNQLIPQGDYDTFIDSWGVASDPNFLLSINACAALAETPGGDTSSQSGMCDPAYDEVFEAQQTEVDPDKRAELVTEAARMIHEFGNVPVLYYLDTLGAYRSDRIDNVLIVDGSPYNRFSLAQATIKGADGGNGTEDGGVPGWLIGTGIGVVGLVVVGGIVVAVRRSKTADERK